MLSLTFNYTTERVELPFKNYATISSARKSPEYLFLTKSELDFQVVTMIQLILFRDKDIKIVNLVVS